MTDGNKTGYLDWSPYQYTVQWGDCDPADIVYYPNYYKWMDNASHAMFTSVGLGLDIMRSQYNTVGFPLVHTEADFRQTTGVGDVLNIFSRVDRCGSKSLTVQHHILCNGRLCVEGREVRIVGHKDVESGKLTALSIPETVREALAKLEVYTAQG